MLAGIVAAACAADLAAATLAGVTAPDALDEAAELADLPVVELPELAAELHAARARARALAARTAPPILLGLT